MPVSPADNRSDVAQLLESLPSDLDVRYRAALEELSLRSRQLADAQRLARLGSWEWDIPRNVVTWSDELYRIYGYEPQEFVPTYQRFLERVHPHDRESVDTRNHQAFADHQPFEDVKRIVRGNGTEILMRTQGEVICDDAGAPLRMLGVCEDVTDQVRAQEARAHLAAIVEGSADTIISVDGRRIVQTCNPGAERMLGVKAADLIGHPVSRVLDKTGLGMLTRILAGASPVRDDCHVRSSDGTSIAVSLAVSGLPDREGGAALVARDMTERQDWEARLQYLADHDAVTGLLSRRAFERELEEATPQRRRGDRGTLVVFDLDNFKDVNDTWGHAAGDEVLRHAASLVRQTLRADDVLARLGGDEFAALLRGAGREDAERVTAAALAALRTGVPSPDGRQRARVSASAGLAEISFGAEAADLLAQADAALYDAKDAGRDRFVFATRTDDARQKMRQRMTWSQRLETALQGDGLVVHAQPIVRTADRVVTSHELLVRLRDADGTLIAPGAFLEVAERYGLIGRIDLAVLERAVAAASATPGSAFAVNVSGVSICDPTYVDAAEQLLLEHREAAGRITMEVTETAAISDIVRARNAAERLAATGYGLALDDFGAGFASFHYLRHLPFDTVKIDRDYVRAANGSGPDTVVVRAVADVARALGKRTVAEGVEDEETFQAVKAMGIDYAQGFHLGRPAPLPLL